MAQYSRTTKRILIDRNTFINAGGCNTYTVFNIGNTIITLDKIVPLLPGEQYEGANENPEIVDFSEIEIEFAQFPYAGPGNVPNTTTNKDNRCVITQSFVTKNI